MMAGEYDENHPDIQAHFNEFGYSRPVLFDKINPETGEEDALAAKEKVQEFMAQTGLRNIVSVMQIGSRLHIDVRIDEFLDREDAPPEYVDGVYVSISRVNSLDPLLDDTRSRHSEGPNRNNGPS